MQRWLGISRRSLELEVDKGLYGAAFYLYNDVDNDDEEQRTHRHITASDASNDAFLPTIGYVMGNKTEKHQGQYILVTLQNRNKQVGTEVCEDAAKHHLAGIERQVAEE